MKLYLKRGFQRVYGVLTSGWVIAVLAKAQAANPGIPLRDVLVRDGSYIALMIFPPLIGYALLFGVLPWVADGFKTGAVKDATSDGEIKEKPSTRI